MLRRALLAAALLTLAACAAPATAPREFHPNLTTDEIPADTTSSDVTNRGYPSTHA